MYSRFPLCVRKLLGKSKNGFYKILTIDRICYQKAVYLKTPIYFNKILLFRKEWIPIFMKKFKKKHIIVRPKLALLKILNRNLSAYIYTTKLVPLTTKSFNFKITTNLKYLLLHNTQNNGVFLFCIIIYGVSTSRNAFMIHK